MRSITYTYEPLISGTHIITPPIYVSEKCELPRVGELIKATCSATDSVMIGEVLEVSASNRTYVVMLQMPQGAVNSG